MKYFKHGDKVKCLFGRCHDRLQGEFNWNTEDFEEKTIRITKDYVNHDQIVVGLEDFNFNYPDDVYQETENHVIFQLFEFAFFLSKEGKEFEVEKPQINTIDIENAIENTVSENVAAKLNLDDGKDTHLMDLVKILKSLSVKKIIFEDGNELEIN